MATLNEFTEFHENYAEQSRYDDTTINMSYDDMLEAARPHGPFVSKISRLRNVIRSGVNHFKMVPARGQPLKQFGYYHSDPMLVGNGKFMAIVMIVSENSSQFASVVDIKEWNL